MRPTTQALSMPLIPSISNVDFADFPECARQLVAMIANRAKTEIGDQLVQFLAAFVHPDYVCNLSMMDKLPEAEKAVCSAFFSQFLTDGLSVAQASQLAAFLQPFQLAAPAFPRH